MAKPTLMVLAAGMGSRYGGLKQVDPVGPNGEVIIDYSIYDAIRAGFGKVVFIIRRDIEEVFREKVGRRFEAHVAVEYAYQQLDDLPGGFTVPDGREKPWGTAHAMWAARGAIGENFGVINADDFYGADSYRILADHLNGANDGAVADYSMVGYVLRNTLSDHGAVNRAVCSRNEKGELQEAVEVLKIEHDPDDPEQARYPNPGGDGFTKLTKESIVSMNMFGFTPSIFGYIGEHFERFLASRREEPKSELYIPTVVNDLIHAGRARMLVLPSKESWFGVTYPEDKPHVVAAVGGLVKAGAYPEKLWG
jgi:NDP-sugar pyrophosphorylase family protein